MGFEDNMVTSSTVYSKNIHEESNKKFFTIYGKRRSMNPSCFCFPKVNKIYNKQIKKWQWFHKPFKKDQKIYQKKKYQGIYTCYSQWVISYQEKDKKVYRQTIRRLVNYYIFTNTFAISESYRKSQRKSKKDESPNFKYEI